MAALSRSEYLKRYMSKDELRKDGTNKKTKKLKRSKDTKLRIIDDDLDIKKLRREQSEAAILDEDAPTVAEVIDERPKRIQELEAYRKNSRWKILGHDEQDEDEVRELDYGVIHKPQTVGRRQDSGDENTTHSRTCPDSSDSDHSPPRKNSQRNNPSSCVKRSKLTTTSGHRVSNGSGQTGRRHDSDTDSSPVRRRTATSDPSSDISPPRCRKNTRHDSSSDNSPSRKVKDCSGQILSETQKNKHQVKLRRIRHDSDSDQSPSQAKHKEGPLCSDLSPSRRKVADSDSDQSPPRKKKTAASDSDQSPPRKKKTAASDSDQSPPRKKKTAASDSDQSPPRKRKIAASDSDQSPPRKKKDGFDADPSPPRNRTDQKRFGHSYNSGPTKVNRQPLSPSDKFEKSSRRSRVSRFDSEPRDKGENKALKTLGGAKAGLSSAREMKEEARKLRAKEENSFQNIDEEMLGKNAKTVLRDKDTGKRRNLKEEEVQTEEELKKKAEQEKKYQQWGRGLKQQAIRDANLAEQVEEASKPLARYKDDQHLDAMLRAEERDDDPMLAFIRSKKKKEEEKSGKKKPKELPRYNGRTAPPPNRFNIMPGYRWDGVDRSNGFEKKIYAHAANKKATKEIAYKWSIEDM